MENAGYNIVTFKVILFTFIYCIFDGFMLSYFVNIATAFKTYYKISNGLLSFVSSISFLGSGIGSVMITFILKIMNRRQIILYSLIGITISNLLISLIDNIVIFVIFRFIGSVFLGFYMVLIFIILTEYLPVNYRGFVLNIVWVGCNIGAVYFLLFCKVYIPNLSYDPLDNKTPHNFHMAIFSILFIEIITIIIHYFFLKDSPRNLILENKMEEAGEILEYYVNRKLTKEELDEIYFNLTNNGENKYTKKLENFNLLFSKRYLKITILMMSIFFLYNFSVSGMNVSSSYYIKCYSKN
jgi:MFS family permease